MTLLFHKRREKNRTHPCHVAQRRTMAYGHACELNGNSVLRRRIHLTGLPQLVLTMDGELLLKDLPPARALLDQSPDWLPRLPQGLAWQKQSGIVETIYWIPDPSILRWVCWAAMPLFSVGQRSLQVLVPRTVWFVATPGANRNRRTFCLWLI